MESQQCGVKRTAGTTEMTPGGILFQATHYWLVFLMGCADSLRQKAQHRQSPLTELHLVQRREDPQRANKPPISCSSEELLLIVLRFIWSHIQR